MCVCMYVSVINLLLHSIGVRTVSIYRATLTCIIVYVQNFVWLARAQGQGEEARALLPKKRVWRQPRCVCFIYPMHSRDDVSGSLCMYVLGGSANSPASGKGDQNAATLTGNDINTNTHTSSKFINRSNSNNSVGQPSLSLSSRSSSSRYSYIHPDTVRTHSV